MELTLVSLITDILLPVGLVWYVLSRMSKATWNERVLYGLIGILAAKSILDTSDLASLHMFEPREDVAETFLRLIKG